MFDLNVLGKYNIDITNLPEGSIIINQETSVLYEFRFQIAIGVLAFLVLVSLILILIFNVEKRKRIESILLKRDANYSKMIANISDVIGIVEEDGTLKYSSENITKQFGWIDLRVQVQIQLLECCVYPW